MVNTKYTRKKIAKNFSMRMSPWTIMPIVGATVFEPKFLLIRSCRNHLRESFHQTFSNNNYGIKFTRRKREYLIKNFPDEKVATGGYILSHKNGANLCGSVNCSFLKQFNFNTCAFELPYFCLRLLMQLEPART